MTPIPKEDALEACKKCTRNGKEKNCICGDIEASKGDIHNPPECLIFQFNQISEREYSLNNMTNIIDEAQAQTVAHIQKTVAKCYPKNPRSAGSNGSTFTKTTKKVLPNSIGNGSKSGIPKEGKLPVLTKTEKNILILISKGTTARNKLATSHKSGVKCIDKYLAKLRKKGYINKDNTMVANIEGTLLSVLPFPMERPFMQDNPKQPTAEGSAVPGGKEHPIRVHAQQWRMGILRKDERYKKKVGTFYYDDGNYVYCGRDAIEINSIQSFIAGGRTVLCGVDAATQKSMAYWELFWHRIENDLNIKLIKPRAQNIKLVKQEYAEVGNELATHCEMSGDKIRVATTEDGKVWLEIDNSFNLRECETKHPQTAREDMRDVVVPFFNDLRDKKPPKLSEVAEVMHKIPSIEEGINGIQKWLELQRDNELLRQTLKEEQERTKYLTNKVEEFEKKMNEINSAINNIEKNDRKLDEEDLVAYG